MKLSLPRPVSSYSYNMLHSQADYGMSGNNVKSEFEWSETPGVTPYR